MFDHPIAVVLVFLANLTLWLLFAASLSGQELFLGVLVALASVVFILYISQFTRLRLVLRFRDIVPAWRIPWYIISGIYEITVILFKASAINLWLCIELLLDTHAKTIIYWSGN